MEKISSDVFRYNLEESLNEICLFIRKGGQIEMDAMINPNRFVKDQQLSETCGYEVSQENENIIAIKLLPEDIEILAPLIEKRLSQI